MRLLGGFWPTVTGFVTWLLGLSPRPSDCLLGWRGGIDQSSLRIVLEHHQAQWWQAEIQGVLIAVNAASVCGLATHVSEVAAAVFGSIGIEDLFVEAIERNANAVVGMALWGEIGHNHKPSSTGTVASHEADYGVAIVVAINPLETKLIKIIAP